MARGKKAGVPARSDLPCPIVISDTIEPTEQVDGKYYTRKQRSELRDARLALSRLVQKSKSQDKERQQDRKKKKDDASR